MFSFDETNTKSFHGSDLSQSVMLQKFRCPSARFEDLWSDELQCIEERAKGRIYHLHVVDNYELLQIRKDNLFFRKHDCVLLPFRQTFPPYMSLASVLNRPSPATFVVECAWAHLGVSADGMGGKGRRLPHPFRRRNKRDEGIGGSSTRCRASASG